MDPTIRLTDETREIIRGYFKGSRKNPRNSTKPQNDTGTNLIQIARYIHRLETLKKNLENQKGISGYSITIDEKDQTRIKSAARYIETAVELLKSIG